MNRAGRFLGRVPAVGLCLAGLLAACTPAADSRPQEPSRLVITPAYSSLPPGGTQAFSVTADVALTGGVEWSASGGSITTEGVYTAPAQAGAYTIEARYGVLRATATVAIAALGTPAALHAQAAAACAEMPVRATGTTFFFCDCQAGAEAGCAGHEGDDTADGLTPATAKRSLGAAVEAFNRLTAGGTVAFCRGGAWSTNVAHELWPDAEPRCAPAADMRAPTNTTTCDLRDYTPPWGGSAKPVIRQTGRADLFHFWSGSQDGIRVLNLDLRGDGGGPGGTAVGQRPLAIAERNSGYLICGNTFDGWVFGLHLNSGATTPEGIDVWGNRFTQNSDDGILGSGTNNRIDANYFENNGAVNGGSHTVYLAGRDVTNASFVNNEIRYPRGNCGGAIMVVHDQFEGLNIENNIIDGGPSPLASCFGLAVDPGGYPTRGGWYRHLTIRRNRVQGMGTSGISVASAPGFLIENNVVVASLASTWGIDAPSMPARTAPADDVTTSGTIRNNTIYYTAAGGPGIASRLEGTGYVIANNVVHYAASAGTCFATELGAGAYAFVGHNACNGTWGTTYDSTPHVTADPLFTGGPTDLRPRAFSPLVGAGSAAHGAGVDLSGTARPSTPAIGAYEPATP